MSRPVAVRRRSQRRKERRLRDLIHPGCGIPPYGPRRSRALRRRYRQRQARRRGSRQAAPAPRRGWRGPRPITRQRRARGHARSAESARHPRQARSARQRCPISRPQSGASVCAGRRSRHAPPCKRSAQRSTCSARSSRSRAWSSPLLMISSLIKGLPNRVSRKRYFTPPKSYPEASGVSRGHRRAQSVTGGGRHPCADAARER